LIFEMKIEKILELIGLIILGFSSIVWIFTDSDIVYRAIVVLFLWMIWNKVASIK